MGRKKSGQPIIILLITLTNYNLLLFFLFNARRMRTFWSRTAWGGSTSPSSPHAERPASTPTVMIATLPAAALTPTPGVAAEGTGNLSPSSTPTSPPGGSFAPAARSSTPPREAARSSTPPREAAHSSTPPAPAMPSLGDSTTPTALDATAASAGGTPLPSVEGAIAPTTPHSPTLLKGSTPAVTALGGTTAPAASLNMEGEVTGCDAKDVEWGSKRECSTYQTHNRQRARQRATPQCQKCDDGGCAHHAQG